MDKAKEALKAEWLGEALVLELYSQALDEMLGDCPEQADFAVLEEQVEKLAHKTLPEVLSNLAQERGIFPPKLHGVRQGGAEER